MDESTMRDGPCAGDQHVLEQWTRRVIRGRDIKAWGESGEPRDRIWWPYDEHLDVVTKLPEPLHAHVALHWDRLSRRSDVRPHDTVWRLFRVQDALLSSKVVWRDMAPYMMAMPASPEDIPLKHRLIMSRVGMTFVCLRSAPSSTVGQLAP